MGFQFDVASSSARSNAELINSYLDVNKPDIFFIKRGMDFSNQAYSTSRYTDSFAMLAFKSDKFEIIPALSNSEAIVLKDKETLKTVKIIRDHEDSQLPKVLKSQGQFKNVFQKLKELFFRRNEQDADLVVYCLSKETVSNDSLKYRTEVLAQNEFTTASNTKLVDDIFYKARVGEEAKIELNSVREDLAPIQAKFTVKDSESIPWKIRQWIKRLIS